ncbi:MAG TPA: FtsX-like permease family protein [Burkholderiales bacterium]|nr:FtsX-like permease family protein [Burkholderiales bacterium]
MSFLREIRLAWKLLARDYRAGEITLIAVAIVVAVAAVTTVGFFTDRVQRVLEGEANRLLGADLVISDSRPLDPELRREASRRGLAVAEIIRFPSMVVLGERTVLTDVRAVSPGYPLRGELRIAERLFGPDRVAGSIPAPGSVWVDERLHTSLDLQAGARIGLGNSGLSVAGVVTHEPGVELGFLSGQPRLLLNAEDLAATGLVQPASRVRYRLQLAGAASAVDAYRDWAQSRLHPGTRIEGVRDARPGVRSALERAEKYLNLAALTSVLLAAVAIALSARRYLQRHLDGCAAMRCLGASQALIIRLYVAHFTVLGGLAAAAGIAIGAGAQAALVAWLGRVVVVTLPTASLAPAVHGAAAGWLLLLGFALPPLVSLAQVPTLRVLRRELGMPRRRGVLAYVLGVGVIAVMILWRAQELRLGATVLGWFVAATACACALTWALLRVAGTFRGRGVSWRFGVANLRRRTLGTILQVVALAMGIMALLTLTVIHNDLLRTWRESLPRNAPNRFVINIQPDQVAAIGRFFAERQMSAPELFPMVRGRLVEIGGRSARADDYEDERARRLITREFNLSWVTRLQTDNRVVAGRWWDAAPGPAGQFSVEKGLADALGIRLGDALTFDMAGTPVTASVTSLRTVDWDSFNVNFFVVAPPGLLEGFPATYVTSFHLEGRQTELLTALVKAFPNIVLIDVAQVLAQVRRMLDHAALGVQFVFLFTLAAGLVVLYAAVASTQDERLYQATIMRTLGASRAQISRAHLAEFGLTGAAAGFVAAAGASGLAYFIAHRFLHLAYAPDPSVWLIGVGGGALGVAAAGYLGTRQVLAAPPLKVLRAIG